MALWRTESHGERRSAFRAARAYPLPVAGQKNGGLSGLPLGESGEAPQRADARRGQAAPPRGVGFASSGLCFGWSRSDPQGERRRPRPVRSSLRTFLTTPSGVYAARYGLLYRTAYAVFSGPFPVSNGVTPRDIERGRGISQLKSAYTFAPRVFRQNGADAPRAQALKLIRFRFAPVGRRIFRRGEVRESHGMGPERDPDRERSGRVQGESRSNSRRIRPMPPALVFTASWRSCRTPVDIQGARKPLIVAVRFVAPLQRP